MTTFKLLSLFSLVVVLHAASGLDYTDNGIAIVGTTEPLNVDVTAGTSREDLISYEFASYIAVHFADFNLPDGDSVLISSPDADITVSHTYTSRGRDQSGTFIASFIPGNSVTVTYKSVGTASVGQGYRITGFSRGYPTMKEESVCGDGDQSLPAKCYAPGTNLSEELPQAYTKAQAVARLLINGTYLCTGWLGGSEGHLFTNHHCFEQPDWALTTDIEFGAESSSCSDQCETQLGCAGKIVATTSTLIADSEDIDYSVIQLPDCVDLSPYGYLQLRESGPELNESIYIPQHPDGYAKRIVSTVDDGDNTTIRSVGQYGACGTDQVGHDADTQGGSSGSPLIASSDNLVVAIHHCGGCMNSAIDVRTVLTDLAAKNITIKNLVASEDVGQRSQPLYAQTPCAAHKPKNSTAGNNHTMPCTHSTNGTNKTTLTTTASNTSTTVTSNMTTSNSTTTTTIASKLTPSPSPTSTIISKTTSTITSKSTTALTSDSVVTSTKSAKATSSSSPATKSSTPFTTTTSSSSSNTTTSSTTTTANSTSTSTTVTTSGKHSSPVPTSAVTRSSGTVDNDTIVGKLKAAVVGSTVPILPPATSPISTPKPTTPCPTSTSSLSNTSIPAPTPASTMTSSATPSTSSSATLSPTAPSTSKPSTANPTPTATVTSTPNPSTKPSTPVPTPAATVTSSPHTANPIPTPTVTSTPKSSIANSTPAPTKPCTPSPIHTTTATSTTKTSTAKPTPVLPVTSTPKPGVTSSTSAPTSTVTPKSSTPASTPASTSVTSNSGGWGDVEQN